jgi:hypothetical protein
MQPVGPASRLTCLQLSNLGTADRPRPAEIGSLSAGGVRHWLVVPRGSSDRMPNAVGCFSNAIAWVLTA